MTKRYAARIDGRNVRVTIPESDDTVEVLLAALKAFVTDHARAAAKTFEDCDERGSDECGCELCQQAYAAIAKAEGR